MPKFEDLPLAELTSTIERLKGELERRRRQEAKQAIADIRAKMEEFDLGIGDLGFSAAELSEAAERGGGSRRGTRQTRPAKGVDRRRKVAPKYRDPESGTTWSGRGRTPLWMVAAIEQGRTRDEFLIEK
ncbi:MAG: H-NS family nucleoid-associated regulatory protein [Phycisphaerales bacterium]|jgi:DNA-binding protein H-NS